ncbi:MAG TPA: DUF4836 family protein [Candidatus Coprenecus pullistercoris]|nr:DUF4836 family protein [Candidatus Coprenecus pullistercoris]
MRTKSFLLSAFAAITAIAVSSCSSNESYTSHIPADAGIVVAFDLGQMLEKSGISDNSSALNVIGSYISEYDSQTLSVLATDILKEPQTSGIDVGSRVFVYTQDNAYSLAGTVTVLFGINDRDLLADNIETFISEEIFDRSGDYYSAEDGNGTVILLYKDYGAVCASTDNEYWGINDALRTLDVDNDITSVNAFGKMASSDADIWGIFELKTLFDRYLYDELNVSPSKLPDFTGAYAYASAVFKESKAEGRCGFLFPSDELKKIKETYGYAKKISGSHLKYLNGDAMAFLVAGIDWEKLLSSDATSLIPGMAIAENMLSTLKGEISFCVNSLELDYWGNPETIDAVFAADASDGEFLGELNAIIGDVRTEGDKAYSFEYDNNKSIYYGFDNGMLYASTSYGDKDGLAKKGNSLSSSEYASAAKDAYIYFGVNIPRFIQVMGDELDDEERLLMSKLKYADIYATDYTDYAVNLYFNGSQNPLETAVALLEEALKMEL